MKQLLDSYFCKGKDTVLFDYSIIRGKGLPIKGFGGISSGPAPLIELHEEVRTILERKKGHKVDVRTIVDIMNLIGKTIISGNVRRTAEIAFGEVDDKDYIDLKNYEKNPERANYGWTSNNSVFAKKGIEYSNIVDNICLNGEPGLAWLDNMKSHGRMCDEPNNLDDSELIGGNPCLEQTLQNYELCNLVETFPAKHEDKEDFLETLRLALLYAKTVTLVDVHWENARKVMQKNRRIGCSLSGIRQFISKNHGDTKVLEDWCNSGYELLKQEDKKLSKQFKVNESIKLTSIKPSGTVSLLAGATPGVHMPESQYYLRRVRIPYQSILVDILKNANYHVELDVFDKSSAVVSFPVNAGEGVKTLKSSEYNVEDQLNIAGLLQHFWADNQVSCTVTFSMKDGKAKAKQELLKAIKKYETKLKGVSFLPKLEEGAYLQMPYEEISKETYLELTKPLKEIDFITYIESDKDLNQEKMFCDTDVCEIRRELSPLA